MLYLNKKMNVYIESNGCDSNYADTSRIKNYFEQNGVVVVSSPSDADEIIFMSCAFNTEKINESVKRLKQLNKFSANLHLGGCLSKIRPEFNSLAHNSFGPREISDLDSYFNLPLSINKISPQFQKGSSRVIRISTGCTGKCSYCAIKRATGFTKSRSKEAIISDLKSALREGVNHITLTSEDCGSWGSDINSSLSDLISSLINVRGKFKIQITSIDPQSFKKDPELFSLLSHEKLFNNIYLPIQSASNRLLSLMGRSYSVEEYLEIYTHIKLIVPQMKITTDFLIGFPTESEDDFKKTLDFLTRLDFYFIQVFLYSDMKFTSSEKIFPKIQRSVALKRMKILMSAFLEKNISVKDRPLINTNVEDIHHLFKK